MCDCEIPEDALEVGERIRFDYYGKPESGVIDVIGKHGYWVKTSTGTYGTASIRCPFRLARKET